MRARFIVICLAVVLGGLPLAAQDIPAGDDSWDTLGAGATDVTLTSADWNALCGANVPDTAVQLKGYNLAGQGTADTLVTRLGDASLPSDGSTATVRIQLKALSFVNDGSHPCSPLTIRVRNDAAQAVGTMTIVRANAAGGTFTAQVPVNAVIEAVDGSGNVVGSTYVSGVLGDQSASPWSYQPPSTGAPKPGPWYPGVDPATQQPARVCRRGNKVLPAKHCYQPPPKCKVVVKEPTPVEPAPVEPVGVASDAAVIGQAEPCYLEATDTAATR